MSEPAEFQIRTATEADVPEMAKMLGDTFQHGEPISDFIFPDETLRSRRQHVMFAALIRHRHLPFGGADVAVTPDNRIVGVILWEKSWVKPTVLNKIKEDLALLAAMRSRVIAGLIVDTVLDRCAPQTRHIRGIYLGCAQEWQRRGAGKALFKSLLAKCAQENVPLFGLYKEDVREYYESMGGTGLGTTTLGRRGPQVLYGTVPPPAR